MKGPSNFGTGALTDASSGSGDVVALIGGYGKMALPVGYVSGAPLSDSMTFDNTTLVALGLTPGTSYTWTWALPQELDDSFTINIVASTPLPAALPLFAGGLGALGMLGWRKRRKPLALAA